MSVAMFIVIMALARSDDYIFVPDEKIARTSLVGDIACPGTIDKTGRFVPDYGYLEKALSAKRSGEALIASFPEPLTKAQYKNEQAYEYRSGKLIPMVFIEEGTLIPEVGEEVIDFRDYKYSPQARRIYNLPGRFVLKNLPTPRKQ